MATLNVIPLHIKYVINVMKIVWTPFKLNVRIIDIVMNKHREYDCRESTLILYKLKVLGKKDKVYNSVD